MPNLERDFVPDVGISIGAPNGRGIGTTQANEIFDSIQGSKAIETGVLEHIEDCSIFIRGVGRDKVSDMTTNVIRKNLIEYTQDQCDLHNIPMREMTPTGACWNPATRQWEWSHDRMLVIDDRPILLVPKSIVSYGKNYTMDRYHRHFVLDYIRKDQLANNGPFVQRKKQKDGRERVWVSKEDLRKNVAPAEKDFIAGFTQQHGNVFASFKEWAAKNARSLENHEINSTLDIAQISNFLLDKLQKTPTGNDHASDYHKLIVGILEFIFYPNLSCPKKEREINDGRKRIDIVFDNSARDGEFYKMHQVRKISSQYVMVECKNYGNEIANPELDQLSGRFSVNRGNFGLMLCRSVKNYDLLIKRCRDFYKDKRELIVPILDRDLAIILRRKSESPSERPEEDLLRDLIREIIMA